MPVFESSEQLYLVIKALFLRIGEEDPSAENSVSASKLIMSIRLSDPTANVTVNARTTPIKVQYGDSSLRPDLEVLMQADTFHRVLLKELPLSKALGNGQLKVKGPVHKSFALADIFHQGQAVYTEILIEQGITG